MIFQALNYFEITNQSITKNLFDIKKKLEINITKNDKFHMFWEWWKIQTSAYLKNDQTMVKFLEIMKLRDEITALDNPKVKKYIDQLINSITYFGEGSLEERRMMLIEMIVISDWFKISLTEAVDKYKKKNENWETTDEGSRYNSEIDLSEDEHYINVTISEEEKEENSTTSEDDISDKHNSKDSEKYDERVTNILIN